MQYLYCHLPFEKLNEYQEIIENYRLPLEVYVSSSEVLTVAAEQWQQTGEWLQSLGIPLTVHGPFQELSPGSFDPDIRMISAKKIRLGAAAAAWLGSKRYVAHLGYEHRKHGFNVPSWDRNALETFSSVCEELAGHDIELLVENSFETNPERFVQLLQTIGYPHAGHCLDIAHVELYSRVSKEVWLQAVAPYVKHVHLSDHNGMWDEHLPFGKGVIDFPAYFELIKTYEIDPTFTFEFGQIENLLQARDYMEQHWQ